MDFDEVVRKFGGLISPNDTVILSREITGMVDLPAELNGSTHIFRELITLSHDKEIILIVSMRAKIEDKLYNCSMLVDKGTVLGVSDEIYPIKGYEGGRTVRSYLTSRGKVCLFVDSDVCYPQLWRECFNGCRYIYSVNSTALNDERVTAGRALARASGRYVLAQFCDACVCINPHGKIESIKWGRTSAFYLPISLVQGYAVDKQVKFVEERAD